jgi:acyl-CoA thioesterase I
MRPFAHCIAAVLLMLVLALLGCQQPDTPPQKAPASDGSLQTGRPDEGTIVAMGNSLTAGLGVPEEQAYPAQLEALLRSNGYRFRVVNAGISGETSSGALSRTAWTLTLKPDIVILETGANDGLRGVSPDVIRQNISAIVQQFQQQNVVVVLAGMRMVQNLGEAYTMAFANVYQTVAQTPDLIFMPFFLDGVGGNPDLNQADGIHPTAEGYRRIVGRLYPYVKTAIEQMRHNRRTAP